MRDIGGLVSNEISTAVTYIPYKAQKEVNKQLQKRAGVQIPPCLCFLNLKIRHHDLNMQQSALMPAERVVFPHKNCQNMRIIQVLVEP